MCCWSSRGRLFECSSRRRTLLRPTRRCCFSTFSISISMRSFPVIMEKSSSYLRAFSFFLRRGEGCQIFLDLREKQRREEFNPVFVKSKNSFMCLSPYSDAIVVLVLDDKRKYFKTRLVLRTRELKMNSKPKPSFNSCACLWHGSFSS